MISQNTEIANHLKSGSSITPIEALQKYGCFRLGARIHDLRQSGMDIDSRMVEQNGKRFAEYRLIGRGENSNGLR